MRMIRIPIAFFVIVVGILCFMRPSHAQIGFDRRGGDYLSFSVRSGDPGACAMRCEHDTKCRAWSFSYPAAERTATCWLKSQVPPRVEDQGSASGVRGTGVIEPRYGMREFSIDRLGGDYRNMEVPPDAAGEPCKAACDADTACRAWTYTRPGYIGPDAWCFLKTG